MIIDFRSRPPYKGFVTEGNFFPRPMEENFKPEDVPAIYRLSKDSDIESARHGDFDLYMQELDRSGIDMQVIHGRMVRRGMARVNNDDVCELGVKWPDRFICFPAVDPADPKGAVKEIERCVEKYGVKGIALEPGWASPPLYVDDRSLDPIYEKCSELGLIVSLTLSALAGEDISYCHPLNLQRMAQRFPDLKITVSHGCWPYVQEFLGVAMVCQNIYFYPDFFLVIPNMPMAEQFIKAANSYMKYRTMFASSYPVRGMKQSLEWFKELPFDDGVLDLLLYTNAAKLLGLDTKKDLT